MTSSIIPQRRLTVAMPPQLRRGRHALARARNLAPSRVEILNQRAAAFFADRLRPAHLDVVRARVAKWSAIGIVIALYVVAVLGAVVR